MQTLIFNTTTKTAIVQFENGTQTVFEDVPTVFIGEGYYEIRQTDMMEDKRYPVFRAPIERTNMIISR